MTEMKTGRPRGLSVWAGLDPFGERTVSSLGQWVGDAAPTTELGEANRLLPRLTIPLDGGGEAAEALVNAIGELLASPPRRRALEFSDRDVLVTHVWLVGDAESPETERLAQWLAGFFREMARRQVEVRVYLVIQNRSWSQAPDAQSMVESRFKSLVDEVLARDKPGSGATLVFVINDRDGIGGRDDPEATERTVVQMLEFALLTDAAHRPIAEAGAAFSPPNLPPVGGWDTVPAFASFASDASRWEAASLNVTAAEGRRDQLREALDEMSPAGWDPRPPQLEQTDLSRELRWSELDLPRWQPRFMAAPGEEYAGLRTCIDTWLSKATTWRRDMLVTYEDNRIRVLGASDRSLMDYMADLDGRIRGVLREDAVEGLFWPLQRLLARSKADLQVQRIDLRQQAPQADPGEPPTPEDSALPRAELADADEETAWAIERKINPMLLIQVTVLTAMMGWLWLALTWQARIAFWPVLSFLEVIAHLIAQIPFLPGNLRDALASVDLVGSLTATISLSAVPSNVWVYSGVAVVVPFLAIAILAAIRQRVAIETAFRLFDLRAKSWRDHLEGNLPAILEAFEYERSIENLAEALSEVDARIDHLESLRIAGDRPVSGRLEADRHLSRSIVPERAPLPPLSEQQVGQIVRSVRRNCIDDLRFRGEPSAVWDCMYREAARIAGDHVPALKDELPAVVANLNRHAPQPGSVKVRQFGGGARAEFAEPAVTKFLGAPEALIPELAGKVDGAVLHSPVADRFDQVIVQTGISPQWALALTATPEPDDTPPWIEVRESDSRPEPETVALPADDLTLAVDSGPAVPPDASVGEVPDAAIAGESPAGKD